MDGTEVGHAAIPYINDEHAEAATKNARLKLVFRLLDFTIQEEGALRVCNFGLGSSELVDAEELQWVVPAAITPPVLQERMNVIDQSLKNPIDLDGKKASQLLSRKTRKRRRRRSPSLGSDNELPDDEPRRKKRERKKKEETKYESAQFIEDSDEEYGDLEAFLEKEKALREKTARAAAESGKATAMRATGTKKRRKQGQQNPITNLPTPDGDDDPASVIPGLNLSSDDPGASSDSGDEIFQSLRCSRSPPPVPQQHFGPEVETRPRPRLLQKSRPSVEATTVVAETINITSDSEQESKEKLATPAGPRAPKKGRLVLSDDEL
jgi:replication fork protection complex subunit Tof1/Swi1